MIAVTDNWGFVREVVENIEQVNPVFLQEQDNIKFFEVKGLQIPKIFAHFYRYKQEQDVWVTPTIEQILPTVISIVTQAYNKAAASLVQDTPQTELLTYSTQAEQAKNLKVGSGDTALIQTIANLRGVSVQVLSEKILAKNQAYSLALGALLGHKQMLEQAIENAQTAPEVANALERMDFEGVLAQIKAMAQQNAQQTQGAQSEPQESQEPQTQAQESQDEQAQTTQKGNK